MAEKILQKKFPSSSPIDDLHSNQQYSSLSTAIPLLQDTITELLDRCLLAEQQLTILQAQGIDISTILMSCGYNPATGSLISTNGSEIGPNGSNSTSLIPLSPNRGGNGDSSDSRALVHVDENGKIMPHVLQNILAQNNHGYAVVPLHNKNEFNVVIACSKLFLTTFAGILASVVGASVIAQGGL